MRRKSSTNILQTKICDICQIREKVSQKESAQSARDINLPIKLFSPKISAKIRTSNFHPNLISANLKVFPRRNLNFENQIHFLEFK